MEQSPERVEPQIGGAWLQMAVDSRERQCREDPLHQRAKRTAINANTRSAQSTLSAMRRRCTPLRQRPDTEQVGHRHSPGHGSAITRPPLIEREPLDRQDSDSRRQCRDDRDSSTSRALAECRIVRLRWGVGTPTGRRPRRVLRYEHASFKRAYL